MPADHLLRRIAAALDPSFVHERLAATYSRIGRPSVDPELTILMLLVGYLFGCLASAPSGVCARRSTSTSPIADTAGLGWMAGCPTTPRAARTGTAGFATETSTASCSTRR